MNLRSQYDDNLGRFGDVLDGCPPALRPWLAALMYGGRRSMAFLADCQKWGVVRAVLANIDCDDLTAKDHRRGGVSDNDLPNDRGVPEAIRLALAADDDPDWRQAAVKWVPRYIPDRAEQVALLTALLARPAGPDTGHAAIFLADLAPDTPALADRLADALALDFLPSRDRHYDDGTTGADAAAEALAKIGDAAIGVLPRVRAMIAAGGCRKPVTAAVAVLHLAGGADDRLRFAGDGTDVSAVFAALAEALPARPELTPVAAGLLGSRECSFVPPPARLTLWAATADGRTWCPALAGRPHADPIWAIYADWLTDRDDPRDEYVRQLHAHAVSHEQGMYLDPEVLATALDWIGWGWKAVYDAVAERVV